VKVCVIGGSDVTMSKLSHSNDVTLCQCNDCLNRLKTGTGSTTYTYGFHDFYYEPDIIKEPKQKFKANGKKKKRKY
jgi:hypothetical protein